MYVRGGDYKVTQPIAPHKSGRDDAWITYSGWPGETAVFNGWNIHANAEGKLPFSNGETVDIDVSRVGILHIHKRHYIRVQGLLFRDAAYQGLGVTGGSGHIDILHNRIHRSVASNMATIGGKVEGNTHHVRVIGNELLNAFDPKLILRSTDAGWQAHTRQQVEKGSSFGAEDLDLYRTDDFEVAFNEVSWGAKEGIDPLNSRRGRIHHNYVHDIFVIPSFGGGKAGIYVDSWGPDAYAIEVDHNVVQRAGSGISFYNEGKTPYHDMSCHHNLLVDNYWVGISVGANADTTSFSRNIRIYNNTCFHNGYREGNKGFAGGIHIHTARKQTDVLVANNISVEGRDYDLATSRQTDRAEDRVRMAYNLLSARDLKGDPARFSQHLPTFGDLPILGDAKFIDPANWNFGLKADSPAVDAGLPDADWDDTDGTRADMGAFPRLQRLPEIPRATATIRVDGDLADWQDIAALPLPGAQPQPQAVRLAWSEDGLYGAAQVVDKDIQFTIPDTGRGVGFGIIRANDLLTVGIQRDGKSVEAEDKQTFVHYFAPQPDTEGPAIVFARPAFKWMRQSFDKFLRSADKRVTAQWRRTPQGYALEFFIPAGTLQPLAWKPQTTLPLFVRVSDGRDTLAEFLKPSQTGKHREAPPSAWQRVILVP